MFTDCPACQGQFHISATQLTAAGGQVICGFCGTQFNALPRLRDRPLAGRLADLISDEGKGIEYSLEITRKPEIAPAGEPSESDNGARVETSPPEEANVVPIPQAEQPPPLERQTEASTNSRVVPAPEFDLAEILLAETPPPRGGASRMFWFLGACLLLLLVGGQYAWFHRDPLLARFPGMVPRLAALCERLDCSVHRYRDLAAIKLINRDVRDHPRFEDALLVNATLSNEAAQPQPFPGVRLLLFDTGGQRIAYRDFQPQEYLDASIDVDAGMAPHRPVHVVLELVGATEAAVSFEFVFF